MSTQNITFNGRPLEQHLNEEAGREIAEVREAEAPRISRHIASKRRANISGARTSPGVVVYQAGQRETHVIVAGNLFPWQNKAPYVRSGHSVLGALEYDAKADKVKCHSCGNWVGDLSQHVATSARWSSSHGSVREYRIRHGFSLSNSGTKLCTPGRAAARKLNPRSKNLVPNFQNRAVTGPRQASVQRRFLDIPAKSETLNMVGKCKAQRLKTLIEFATALGRTPKVQELNDFRTPEGIHPLRHTSLMWLFKTSLSGVLLQAGLKPTRRMRASL